MTILFDLDGTLLDTAPDFAKAINQLLEENKKAPIELDTVRGHISHGSREAVKRAFEIHEEHPEIEDLTQRFINYYEKTVPHSQAEFFPGMIELLQSIEDLGVDWGVVTNKPGFLTEPLLKSLQLHHRAKCIVSGDTTPHLKPHPAPLFKACEILSVRPEDCLYVGDAERDIIAGNKAGMTTIVALFGYIPSLEEAMQWEANHFVKHSADILPQVEKWQKR